MESTKPTFYPHSFKARESEFDVDSFLRGNVMDRIQEDRFKGFYNFTFIYLIATVTMLVVGCAPAVLPQIYNFAQRGWLLSLHDVLCRRSVMGAVNALLLCGAILLSALWYYLLWRLRKRFGLSNAAYFGLYGVLQLAYVGSFAAIVWNSDIPFGSAARSTVDRSPP